MLRRGLILASKEGTSAAAGSQELLRVHGHCLAEEEILNRIAAIQAAAEILDDNDTLPNRERHAFLAVIQCETARLHALVRDVVSELALLSRQPQGYRPRG